MSDYLTSGPIDAVFAALRLATVTGDVSNGYTVTLNVGVDTTTSAGSGGGLGAPPSGAPTG